MLQFAKKSYFFSFLDSLFSRNYDWKWLRLQWLWFVNINWVFYFSKSIYLCIRNKKRQKLRSNNNKQQKYILEFWLWGGCAFVKKRTFQFYIPPCPISPHAKGWAPIADESLEPKFHKLLHFWKKTPKGVSFSDFIAIFAMSRVRAFLAALR